MNLDLNQGLFLPYSRKYYNAIFMTEAVDTNGAALFVGVGVVGSEIAILGAVVKVQLYIFSRWMIDSMDP